MSANEYIRWRYATGEDREAEDKVTRKISDEERAALEAKLMYGGVKRQFEAIQTRRKLKKSYEYEVSWKDLSEDNNSWIEREDLVTLGFEKYVNEFDMKEATKLGLMSKPLTTANVERHLADLGMTAEIGTHNCIRGYSGGQKVRLVVAAATWLNPHVVVLDEPSNYLDRDSLGAFAAATWAVGDGRVVVEGGAANGREKGGIVGDAGGDVEVIDAFGNTNKVKAPKKTNLSNKERKAREKARKAQRERGEEVSESEEDD
jgi:elongation factor 3